MAGQSYLLDSNILIRWVQRNDPHHDAVEKALALLVAAGTELHYTSQNLGEFWNALTRPIERNGYGRKPLEANDLAKEVETQFSFLPDNELVHYEWRNILVDYAISGVQVHDARLVAAMRVHHLDHILTLNARDFRRFPDIEAVLPEDVT